ncbi:uncharacterized protein PgNI_12104 [Pyricularia grisea]|uniref:Enoyl reductase (ER) domain-containing protein n=1 Tax=Pyricularia grisea TaxID=148305 RepID=A0A6P8AQS4_PYRGI|nr:uncharacterized protein PgNI_12104 [Pyricularia grisea]TLD04393.1 hypothetical protein PgNI_12104 [Pyricularia grisea]
MSGTRHSSAPALCHDKDDTLKVIPNIPVPELVEGEVVVIVMYSGVNPADIVHDFKVGDMMAGYTPTGIGRPSKYGTHQEYLSCPERLMFKVPENLPPTHAACITAVTATAADGLYNVFGFPLPGQEPASSFRRGPWLIWGGSGSVGICMLQLARASCASPIFVTASPRRHELLKRLGTTRCFDYRDPDVISQIRTAAGESGAGPIAYAADCTGTGGIREAGRETLISAEQAEACGDGNTLVLSVVSHETKQYKLMMASANRAFQFRQPNGIVLSFPERPEDCERIRETLKWAVDKYGTEFEMSKVEVFEGSAENALIRVQNVMDRGEFGKLVLVQPPL